MKYELIAENNEGTKIYGRVDDDGLIRVTCVEEDKDYQAWLESQKK
jgi:hypothetical protein